MLPEGVELTEEADGVVLLLRRDPRLFRRCGWMLVTAAFGVVVVSTIILAILGFLPGGQFGGIPWVLIVPVGLAGLACLAAGIVLIRTGGGSSTTRITLDALALVVSDRFLWMRWRERIARSSIRSFIVEPLFQQPASQAKGNLVMSQFGQVRVLLESGESKRVAFGHARAVLAPVVAELARLCAPPEAVLAPAGQTDDGAIGHPERVTVRFDRPATSRVTLEEHADGVTFVIPPPGLFRGSMGLFVVALIWNAIAVAITVVFFINRAAQQPWDAGLLIPLGALAIGAVLMLSAVNLGGRRAAIAVVNGRLLVMQSSLFGSRRHEWDRSELCQVRVGLSNVRVNDTHLAQLQIEPREGKHFTMLTGRAEPELDWMAEVLRRSLRLNGSLAPADNRVGMPREGSS